VSVTVFLLVNWSVTPPLTTEARTLWPNPADDSCALIACVIAAAASLSESLARLAMASASLMPASIALRSDSTACSA
jgi:hypothetical protein